MLCMISNTKTDIHEERVVQNSKARTKSVLLQMMVTSDDLLQKSSVRRRIKIRIDWYVIGQ